MFTEQPNLIERMKRMAAQFEGDAVADVLAEAARRLKTAEDTLLSFTPNGSEYFLRDGEGFRVDVAACERVIRENYDKGHRAMIEAARARKANRPNETIAPSHNEGETHDG